VRYRIFHAAIRLATIATLVGTLSQPAWAQAPTAEISGAYVHLSDPDFDMPLGWLADVGIGLSDAVSVVGEIGRSSRTVAGRGIPVTLGVTTYQGGVRVTGRTQRLAVFGQALGGLGQFGGRAKAGPVTASVSLNAVSLQFGGGVIVPINGRVGIRGSADYRYAAMVSTDFPVDVNELRLSGGLLIAIGRR